MKSNKRQSQDGKNKSETTTHITSSYKVYRLNRRSSRHRASQSNQQTIGRKNLQSVTMSGANANQMKSATVCLVRTDNPTLYRCCCRCEIPWHVMHTRRSSTHSLIRPAAVYSPVRSLARLHTRIAYYLRLYLCSFIINVRSVLLYLLNVTRSTQFGPLRLELS